MTGRPGGAAGISPGPSQRWVAAIHANGMNKGTKSSRPARGT
jgi:hypothetical protein